jgi:hypothetical protein
MEYRFTALFQSPPNPSTQLSAPGEIYDEPVKAVMGGFP